MNKWVNLNVVSVNLYDNSTKIRTIYSIDDWSKTIYLQGRINIPTGIQISVHLIGKKTSQGRGVKYFQADAFKHIIDDQFLKQRLIAKYQISSVIEFMSQFRIFGPHRPYLPNQVMSFLGTYLSFSTDTLNEMRLYLLSDLPKFITQNKKEEFHSALIEEGLKNEDAHELTKLLDIKRLPILWQSQKYAREWLSRPYSPYLTLSLESRDKLSHGVIDQGERSRYIAHDILKSHENTTGATFLHSTALEKFMSEKINSSLFINDYYRPLPHSIFVGRLIDATLCEIKNGEHLIQHQEISNAENKLSHYWETNSTVHDAKIPTLLSQANVEQNSAIRKAFVWRCSCVVGRPGTGKSWLLQQIAKQWQHLYNGNVIVVSSYHQPLKNLQVQFDKQLTDHISFTTICAMQELDTSENKTLVVLEEAGVCTMIDMYQVFHNCFSNPHNQIQILLVGDHQQLKPIGAGQPLSDFLRLYQGASTILLENMRTSSTILLNNILCIQNGDARITHSDTEFKWHKDVYEITYENKLQFYNDFLIDFDFKNDIIIVHKNVDRDVFNVLLHNLHMNTPDSKLPVYSKARLTLQTRIVCKKTYPCRTATNGMRGHITAPYIVKCDSGQILNIQGMEDHWDLAYAITAHKSQGAEYIHPFIYTFDDYHVRRDWIYTAVSRAKQCITYLVPLEQHNCAIQKVPKISNSLIRKRLDTQKHQQAFKKLRV